MRPILQKILTTTSSRTEVVLRLALGIMIFPHGLQKTVGVFGGYGFSGTMSFFTETLGIPAIFAFLVIMAEFLGGLGLLVGFGTRIAAFGVGMTMAVAAVTSHVQNGFFMNWFGNQKGEGFEFHLLAVAISIAILIRGAGIYSVDSIISRQNARDRS